jgi:hypothetical protein
MTERTILYVAQLEVPGTDPALIGVFSSEELARQVCESHAFQEDLSNELAWDGPIERPTGYATAELDDEDSRYVIQAAILDMSRAGDELETR